MATHTNFHGVTDIGQSLLSDNLEVNLKTFCEWSMLGIGGFYNVTIPLSGVYGGWQHKLRLVDDPNYDAGQVWEAFRQDWVWETGVENPTQPIRVSGVNVNSVFHGINSTGAYGHHVNYPLGRVIFDNAISPTSLVTCEYSYRYVQFSTADAPWWKEIQRDSFRLENQFSQTSSGAWGILAQNRVQLPHVVVEAVPRVSRVGFQLGGTWTVEQDVLFTVLGQTHSEKKMLHDILTYLDGHRILSFDKNVLFEKNLFPLDSEGSPVSGAFMYPDLIKSTGDGGAGWRQLRFEGVQSSPQPQQVTGPLHVATVRATIGLEMP